MGNLFQDIRYAVRTLGRNPGFGVVAILTLTIGIGGIATIFSFVNGVLLRPLPYRDPEKVVTMAEVGNATPNARPFVRPAQGADWVDRTDVFEGITMFQRVSYTLAGTDDLPVVVTARVPRNHLSVLGIKPEIGRDFVESDLTAEPAAAILTRGFWERRLGRDPAILGKRLTFAEGIVTIVGVLPRDFSFPFDRSVEFLTLVPADSPSTLWVGRLKSSISATEAEHRINALVQQIDRGYPNARQVKIQKTEVVDPTNRAFLLLLFGMLGFILLIAVMNMANLMLSRSITRQHEISVRAAIGASRWRLVRQLLAESLLLSMIGGMLGLLAASWGADLLAARLPSGFPRVEAVYVDGNVVAFVFAVTVLAAVAFGLSPAYRFSQPDLRDALQGDGRRTSESRYSRYLRQILISTEIGLATVLLVGSALTAKSFWKVVHIPLGVETENVTTVAFRIPADRYNSDTSRTVLYVELLDRLRRQPGVELVSLTNKLPAIGGFFFSKVQVEGSPSHAELAVPVEATRDYFRIFAIPFLNGRPFEDSERAVVVNKSFAQKYWAAASPLGRLLKVGGSENPWLTVVGVVPDVKMDLGTRSIPQIFRPCSRCTTAIFKTRNNSVSISGAVYREFAAIDPAVRVTGIRTMEESFHAAGFIVTSRFRTWLFGLLAGTGLSLALIGIYGVTSYTAAQRKQEIGIRVVLGASQIEVVRMMLAQSLAPLLIGIGGGVIGAFTLTRLLRGYLFEVSPSDPVMFLIVVMLLGSASILANLLPIFRSAMADPLATLRGK